MFAAVKFSYGINTFAREAHINVPNLCLKGRCHVVKTTKCTMNQGRFFLTETYVSMRNCNRRFECKIYEFESPEC